jgi:transglutaminase-like putative cysteine protease
MNTLRRSFLQRGLSLGAIATAQTSLWSNFAQAQTPTFSQRSFAPTVSDWREFEVTTRVDISAVQGETRVWLPIASLETPWQTTLSSDFVSNGESKVLKSGPESSSMLASVFSKDNKAPFVELVTRVKTKNRQTHFGDVSSQKATWVRESQDNLEFYKRSTRWLPTDGIVKQTALKVTQGAKSDEQKAKLIYDWVVANTYREVKVRGCGEGDIKSMLESGNLGGKCADINAVFVGLCRAAGLPARDVYGLRLVPSAFGYKELSGNPSNLKGSQHCRAEVYLSSMGWVAMDPADVAKVMRQETPTWIKQVNDPVVKPVYSALFGSWEGNWMGWNTSHDVVLAGSSSKEPLPFLMYPIAENDAGRFDSYDPDLFKYQITAKEIKPVI